MRRSIRVTTHSASTAVPLVALSVLIAGPAFAQQRVGGGGHALDANTRQGSGGRNTQENRVDYQQRNNVVTGNVSGGRAFRGDVGYQAPNEFRDALGGDDLFDFRRRSLSSDPNAIRRGGGTYRGGQSVYRSFSTQPGTGTNTRQSTRISPGQTNLYDFGAVSQSQGQPPLALPGEGAAPAASGGAGQPGDLSLSPLLGARPQTSGPGVNDPTLDPQTADLDIRVDTGLDTAAAVDTNTPADEAAGSGTDARLDVSLRPQQQTDPRVEGRPLLQGEGLSHREASDQAATSVLGRQLQAQLRRQGRQQPRTLDQQVQQIRRSLFDRLEQQRADPDDTAYQNVLAAMKSQRGGVPESGQPDEAGQQTNENPWGSFDLQGPTEQQMNRVEQARRQALKQTFDQPGGPGHGRSQTDMGRTEGRREGQAGADQQATGSNEGQQQGENSQSNANDRDSASGRSVDQILKRLDHQAPRLETLTGERKSRVNRLLREAETRIGKGSYFDAQRLYRQLLVDAPNRPMVRAGLINAQLGAGMIRSAAGNMRKLFNMHPELIAVKYGKDLLPPKERLAWLQKELQRMIQANQGAEPGMMLAYLGHQLGQRPLVRYGLASAESQAPREPLLPVLRRIWLEGKNAPEKATGSDNGQNNTQ